MEIDKIVSEHLRKFLTVLNLRDQSLRSEHINFTRKDTFRQCYPALYRVCSEHVWKDVCLSTSTKVYDLVKGKCPIY